MSVNSITDMGTGHSVNGNNSGIDMKDHAPVTIVESLLMNIQ